MINPMIVEGQVRGGVAQGIAGALYEELVYDEDGPARSTTSLDGLPGADRGRDPRDRDPPPRDAVARSRATGAKGVGEGGTIGAPAAVLNAVNDAARAPRRRASTDIPITPDDVLAALHAAERKEGSAATMTRGPPGRR